jgi:murein L,D-transpeptidase YafK
MVTATGRGSHGLNRQSAWVRTLLASAAVASAVALAGCDTDGTSPLATARAMAPLSNEMLSLLEQKNMPKETPILVRLFKEEAELEVWKQDATGQYALLKTYPICRWSGELGPKVKEGDRQAPEGFYTITPGQMNPNSAWYLSFNLGFPNAFDRANERTGAFLMVHGDCSSAGCYAMTDEQMGEIYALGREAFFGGQKSFQVQAYPFHMTPLNMARHRNSPHMAFWRMIKEGSDHFEVSRQEPKIDVCEKRYVFDANASSRFDPKGRCPTFEVPAEIATGVADKKAREDREFAALVARGTPTVAIKTGADGGMNKIFLAKLRQQDKFDEGGRIFSLASTARVPEMGNNVNPPKVTADGDTTTASVQTPVQAPQSTRVASADSGQPSSSSTSMFGGLMGATMSKLFGGSSADTPPAQPAVPAAKPRPADAKATAHRAPAPVRTAQPAPRPQVAEERRPAAAAAAAAAPAPAPAPVVAAAPAPAQTTSGLMAGAQPVVSSNSFEGRWGGTR